MPQPDEILTEQYVIVNTPHLKVASVEIHLEYGLRSSHVNVISFLTDDIYANLF